MLKKDKNYENHSFTSSFGIIIIILMVCFVIVGRVKKTESAIFIKPEATIKAEAKEEIIEDKRIGDLKRFFNRYDSPLAEHSATFIEVADRYGFDWTLLPAIASQESGFGKKTPSCALYNPFGWTSTTSPCGYYRFEGFDQAIKHVAKRISELSCYARFKETKDIKELAKKYNSVSPDEWVKKVSFFQEKIKNEALF